MTNVIKLCSIFVFFLFNFPILIFSDPQVPCYFIFGDSLVDNGNNNNLQTTAKSNYPPYGVDYPGGAATGRFSNGLNLADFIAFFLGFVTPIQPYATVPNNDIERGINYGSGGAGILIDTGNNLGNVIYLDKQLLHHQTAISRIAALQGNRTFTKEYLKKCIYTVGMGNNDYIQNYFAPESHISSRILTTEQFATLLRNHYYIQLQFLYNLGARKIAVIPPGLPGCTPAEIAKFGADQTGCVSEINNAVNLFNAKLQPLVDDLNNRFKDAQYILVDQPPPLDPTIPGLIVNAPCCQISTQGGTRGQCLPNLPPCPNRLPYIFYDGFHPTENTYFALANSAYTTSISKLV